jgi:hypothetical protein
MSLLTCFDQCIIEQFENYQKGSYRNRCYLGSANGIQRMSIPLKKGKNEQQPIRKVLISNEEPWQANHWKSIRAAYGKSPFYYHYCDELERLLRNQEVYLFDYSIKILKWLIKTIGINCSLALSEKFRSEPTNISDLRGMVLPNSSESRYIFNLEKYEQPFSDRYPFTSDLSILDLLFCKGPESLLVLEKTGIEIQ